MRIFAIDWSGAASGADKNIWVAEVRGAEIRRLECGRSRDQLVDFLRNEAGYDPRFVVGLDFAFSFPAWFLRLRGVKSASEMWRLAAVEGEAWLAACEPPFWGRLGRSKPIIEEHFRQTEREAPSVGGIQPKSVFQIGGAGAVGTGSIRGMPILHKLEQAGFSIWPFDGAGWPKVVEIYPRLLMGPVVKGNRVARQTFFERQRAIPANYLSSAIENEDAFDALVSALRMADHHQELMQLSAGKDQIHLLEGRIWHPSDPSATTRSVRPQPSATNETFSLALDDALVLAAAAHHEDVRKGTAIPYITHPVQVARILERHGYHEGVIIAGLLHNVLEDSDFGDFRVRCRCQAVVPELAKAAPDAAAFGVAVKAYISQRFGADVFSMVDAVTEQKVDSNGGKRDWEVRKKEQLEHLRAATNEIAALKAADTLHNANAILTDFGRGLHVFERFNESPERTRWWYEQVSAIVSQKLGPTPLSSELQRAVVRIGKAVEEHVGLKRLQSSGS